jgi:sec-independent protein translocase protein TatA
MRLEPWHVIVLLLIVVVLFGYKRLPDAARSMGRSMRIFKSEVESMRHDGDDHKDAAPKSTEPLSGRIVDEPPAAGRTSSSERAPDDRR